MTDSLLTVGDVAQLCQVHCKTVTRAIQAGRLRAVRLGRRGAYRIRPEDLDQWIADSAIGPPAPMTATPDISLRRPARGRLVLDVRDGRLM